jgi:hypothetical protein
VAGHTDHKQVPDALVETASGSAVERASTAANGRCQLRDFSHPFAVSAMFGAAEPEAPLFSAIWPALRATVASVCCIPTERVALRCWADRAVDHRQRFADFDHAVQQRRNQGRIARQAENGEVRELAARSVPWLLFGGVVITLNTSAALTGVVPRTSAALQGRQPQVAAGLSVQGDRNAGSQ